MSRNDSNHICNSFPIAPHRAYLRKDRDWIYSRACSVRRSVFSELVTASPGKIARQAAYLPSLHVYASRSLSAFPLPLDSRFADGETLLPFWEERLVWLSLLKYLRARHRRKPSSFCSSFQSFFSSLLHFFARCWFFLHDTVACDRKGLFLINHLIKSDKNIVIKSL